MTPSQLRTQHPETYAAVIAEERDRVLAHQQAGAATGETQLAAAAIADGRSFEACSDQYLAAGRAKRAQTLRALDSDVALDAIQGATSPPAGGGGGAGAEGPDMGDQVAARVAKQLGHKPKAATL